MQKFYNILLLTFIILIAFDTGVMGVEKPKKKPGQWDMSLSLSSVYDNNILRNSEKYLERFRNNEDPDRFHINKYDDIVMKYELRLGYTRKIIGKMNSIFSVSADHNSFSYNSIKTWSSFSFSLQQFIASPTSFLVSYSHIPDFYIKHYRDYDWGTFKPMSFAKNDFSFWLQHNLLPSTRARAYFSYMKYFYNQHFTEYDSENLLYGIRLFHSFSRNITADAGYRYITSDAKGFDSPGENKLISDDGDASYNEHVYMAGVEIKMPKVFNLNNNLGASVQYSSRSYTTHKTDEEDRIHSGRKDDFYILNFNYNISLLNDLALSAYLRWVSRNSDTNLEANRTFLSDEKDFTQTLIGLGFNYKFKF